MNVLSGSTTWLDPRFSVPSLRRCKLRMGLGVLACQEGGVPISVLRESREQHPKKACVMPCRVRIISEDAPCHSECEASSRLKF
jgi:hypothetical protein